MTLPAERIREMQIRREARFFAQSVKDSNMAIKLPDALIDSLDDDEVPTFLNYLTQFGLVRRPDFYWEKQ